MHGRPDVLRIQAQLEQADIVEAEIRRRRLDGRDGAVPEQQYQAGALENGVRPARFSAAWVTSATASPTMYLARNSPATVFGVTPSVSLSQAEWQVISRAASNFTLIRATCRRTSG